MGFARYPEYYPLPSTFERRFVSLLVFGATLFALIHLVRLLLDMHSLGPWTTGNPCEDTPVDWRARQKDSEAVSAWSDKRVSINAGWYHWRPR